MSHYKFIIFFCLVSFNLLSFEPPAFCSDSAIFKDCQCELDPSNPKIKIPKWTESLHELNFINSNIEKAYNANELLKKSLLKIFRAMRDGKSDPDYLESKKEIDTIYSDFLDLNKVSLEIQRQQEKFNFCIHNCSRSHALEISDNLERLQKLRITYLIKRPILANSHFENLMKNISSDQMLNFKTYDYNTFWTNLKDSIFENLSVIDDKSKEYETYLNDLNGPIVRESNQAYIDKYNSEFISRFPNLVEDFILQSSRDQQALSIDDKKIICTKSSYYEKYLTSKKLKGLAVDASLLILPILGGPLAPAIESGVVLSRGARLVTWGISNAQLAKTITSGSRALDLALLGHSGIALKSLKDKCIELERVLLERPDISKYHELKKCQLDLSSELTVFLIGSGMTSMSYSADFLQFIKLAEKTRRPTNLISTVLSRKTEESVDAINQYLLKNGTSELKGSEQALEFRVGDKDFFTIVDMTKTSKIDPVVKKVSEDYWRFVADVYKERLNLTPSEIENFVKSSIEAGPRTKIVLNTGDKLKDGGNQFKGGIGLVQSKNKLELLPLEKATGIKIDRKPNEKIVEIVRLTASKDVEAEKTSSALVSQIMSLVVSDKEVGRVFIYTSKVHSRLYRKMGIPQKAIKSISDRDVMIEITREEAEEILKSKVLQNKRAGIYFPALFNISSKRMLS